MSACERRGAGVTPEDPDPERAQLLQLRPVLVWWMCERARRKTVDYAGHRPDATMQTADFGVFIDFMSMHQPDSGWKEEWKCNTTYSKPEQKASHWTWVFTIWLTPAGASSVPCYQVWYSKLLD